jgi:hypothetical protein
MGRNRLRDSVDGLAAGFATGATCCASGLEGVLPLARGNRDVTDSFGLALKIFFIRLGSFGLEAGVVMTTSGVMPVQFENKSLADDPPKRVLGVC